VLEALESLGLGSGTGDEPDSGEFRTK
jgi:hypothetical protein